MKNMAFWLAAAMLVAGLSQGCEASKHEDPADASATDGSTSDGSSSSDAPADTDGNSMGGMDM